MADENLSSKETKDELARQQEWLVQAEKKAAEIIEEGGFIPLALFHEIIDAQTEINQLSGLLGSPKPFQVEEPSSAAFSGPLNESYAHLPFLLVIHQRSIQHLEAEAERLKDSQAKEAVVSELSNLLAAERASLVKTQALLAQVIAS